MVKTRNIKSVVLQRKIYRGTERLNGDVNLMSSKEAGVEDDRIWKLKCCLYGPWGMDLIIVVRQFLKSVVEVLKSLLDTALFY